MAKKPGGTTNPTGPGNVRRDLAVRVKTARKRTHSSTLWLERQLNDPFVSRARAEGFRSRAAFKLQEIDDRFKLLRRGQRIIDLGCAPGGWAQIAAARTGSVSGAPGAMVVGIDLLEVDPIAGVLFERLDFTDEHAPARLKQLIGGDAHGVLSDMAANTTGHQKTDHLRIVGLAELAVDFACEVLTPGGFFICKLFQGGDTATIITGLKRDFAQVRHVKPAASRANSSELYVLATGFRGERPSRLQALDHASTEDMGE